MAFQLPPYSKPEKRVIPRSAASLIIIEDAATDPHVLLGKRVSRHNFMPDVYVFPGGALDAGDFRAASDLELHPEVGEKAVTSRRGLLEAKALGVAAIRETAEETGLIVGVPGDKVSKHLGEETEAGFKSLSLEPALQELDYIGRAITPPNSPRRFHARFFMVDADHVHGELGGSGELEDLAFVPIKKALEMKIIDVTTFMLEEVERQLAQDRIDKARARPRYTYRFGKPVISYL